MPKLRFKNQSKVAMKTRERICFIIKNKKMQHAAFKMQKIIMEDESVDILKRSVHKRNFLKGEPFTKKITNQRCLL